MDASGSMRPGRGTRVRAAGRALPKNSANALAEDPHESAQVSERACRVCGRETWSPRSPYCREHRPPPEVRALWAKKTRGSRGYGAAHRKLRAGVARVVEAGEAVCARCGRPIRAGEDWDLDHSTDRTGYLGPSHRSCNRQAGARNGAAVTNGRRRPRQPSWLPARRDDDDRGGVCRWSRVWFLADPARRLCRP
jgi:hypothetical protein